VADEPDQPNVSVGDNQLLMGWIIHLWFILDAALWKPKT
jgi:hypothetical protein